MYSSLSYPRRTRNEPTHELLMSTSTTLCRTSCHARHTKICKKIPNFHPVISIVKKIMLGHILWKMKIIIEQLRIGFSAF